MDTKSSTVFTNTSSSTGSTLFLQPIMKPMNSKLQLKFPKLVAVLRGFTICCVILGILSMGMQVGHLNFLFLNLIINTLYNYLLVSIL